MEYIGEHILPGKIGHLFVISSFVFAILSCVSYFLAYKNKEWIGLAKFSFRIHSISVLGIIAVLFYIISQHYFEYQYVWQHSSLSLPKRYMISCFWEGQEGSFLLWMFWHVLLGNLLVRKINEWEAPVMTVFTLVQVFLTSMLLGIYIFGIKIGSTPFILIRELPEYIGLPFTQMADYLSLEQFKDGRGLNPLLQNYWMTIHPPTLFLGFSATLIPFCFAIAGLWRKKYNEWIQPALPWTFFAIMILGTGILMGGAWAYEALSFGGFWAWDPVENASLVPWIILLAAGHLMLIQKAKKTSAKATFVFTLLAFILVLYSTFLTRSGILGDTSVHSFVDLGLNAQLLCYLFFFIALAFFLFIYRYKEIPSDKKDESVYSREFWMFIASLVLLLASFQVLFTTSIPVINKVIGTNLAPPIDAIAHYNSWQIPFAIIITLLVSFTQYLSYNNTKTSNKLKVLITSIISSFLLLIIIVFILKINNPVYIILLFTSIFAFVANLVYWLKILKGKIAISGASIAHIGFALIILGSLISNGKKEVISKNSSFITEDISSSENIVLEKNDTIRMGDYYVSWVNEKREGINQIYEIEYYKESENKQLIKQFTLEPFIQLNETMGNVAEPSTKHFITKDIFTHLTWANLEENEDGYSNEATLSMSIGDTLIYSSYFIVLDSVTTDYQLSKITNENHIISLIANLSIINMQGEIYLANPIYLLQDNFVSFYDFELEEKGLKFRFKDLDVSNPTSPALSIIAWEHSSQQKEFIIMKAIIFPGINLLWIGCVIMVLGCIIAVFNRRKTT